MCADPYTLRAAVHHAQAVAAAAQPKAREPYSGEKLLVVDADDWAVQHLREHMGERVAFYFAFLNHYTAALAPVRAHPVLAASGSVAN